MKSPLPGRRKRQRTGITLRHGAVRRRAMPDLAPVLPLLGVLIGAIATFAGASWQESRRTKNERLHRFEESQRQTILELQQALQQLASAQALTTDAKHQNLMQNGIWPKWDPYTPKVAHSLFVD